MTRKTMTRETVKLTKKQCVALGNRLMESSTPLTDKITAGLNLGLLVGSLVEHARNMERQRDAANRTSMDLLASKEGINNGFIQISLVSLLAHMCRNAQEHIGNTDAWPTDTTERANLLQCTSYQIAVFLSEFTVNGVNGVDFDIVLEELADNTSNLHGYMVKTHAAWCKIIDSKVKELGGFKSGAYCFKSAGDT